MAAIDYTFVQQNTEQSWTTSVYTDISGASISSGNFTAGKKYLIYITAQISEDGSSVCKIRTLHGSTAFDESEFIGQVSTDTSFRLVYSFLDVWTAVSGEGIKLQHATPGTTVRTDTISMLAINLSDDLVENTDWKYAERTNNDSLSTTPTDGASITFTPGGASDWLVLAYAQHNYTDGDTYSYSRMIRSGGASSSVPEVRLLALSTTQNLTVTLARVFALTATSNTFKEQSEATASQHTRDHSAIFAINLNKFAAHANAYTAGPTEYSTTNYSTELRTISIAPTVTGDVWIGAYFTDDVNTGIYESEFRVQVDNADQPAGQTSANYQFTVLDPGDNTQYWPRSLSTLTNLSNATHTIDLDASCQGSGNEAKEITLWAIAMELAGTAAYTMPAASGSYIYSGTAATLRPGSFTILQHTK